MGRAYLSLTHGGRAAGPYFMMRLSDERRKAMTCWTSGPSGTCSADGAVAGDLDGIAEDILIAHLTVVRDVGAFHKDVPTADDGGDVAARGAADDHVLTDHVVVTDDECGLLALVGEVLG